MNLYGFRRFGTYPGIVGAAVILPAFAAVAGVTVAVTPARENLAVLGTQQLHAAVAGSANQDVTWLVNGIPGGAPSLGLISASGLYTAPATVPAAFAVEIEAQSVATPLVAGTATISLAASPSTGPVYLVATAGSDANPGTAGKPWRTIQHAVATVPAGATIEVRAGTYHELVTISRSGSASAGFITLAAYPGEKPVIDGTGLGIPNGENGLVTIAGASFVRVRGFELRNYVSASTARDPVGIYVYGAGSHIEILNNHIHNITTTVTTSAGDALGIAIYGSAVPAPLQNIIVDGNELDTLTTGYSESLTLSGNVVDFQVTNNLVHDNDNIGIDVAGYEGTAPVAAYDRARHGWVAGNTVYNISSKTNPAYGGALGADGIYVDGGNGVVIERNLVHHTDIGIEAASEHSGKTSNNVTIRNNIVYHSYTVGISIGGYAGGVGGTTNGVIVNNTLFADDSTLSQQGEFQVQYHASANLFANNIVVANGQGLLVRSFVAQAAPAVLENNLYFSPLGAANSQWIWNNLTYTGFSSYRNGSKTDLTSRFAAPLFVNSSQGDFRLAPTSPALGAGLALPLSSAGRFDFAGNPRRRGNVTDQGAFQH